MSLTAALRLLEFAKGSRIPSGGFAGLDEHGRPVPEKSVDTIATARMTLCFSIGCLVDSPGAERFAKHGVDALFGLLRDPEFGGYLVSTAGDAKAARKQAYQASFVLLAASTARIAQVPGAYNLFEDAQRNVSARFWSETDGALVESWDRTFSEVEPCWGANANMHGVEAMLSAYASAGDDRWRDRALRVADRFVNTIARSNAWMLPEHFDSDWTVLRDYGRASPEDIFRPYGVTIGHLFEWSRLLLELRSAFDRPEPWLAECALHLYTAGKRLGWAADGADGFVYTVDWAGKPVVRLRPHWVVAEAISAAATWARFLPGGSYDADLAAWQGYADMYLRDPTNGSWRHELDQHNRPSAQMFRGRPDVYHALQCELISVSGIAPSLALRVAESLVKP